MNEAKRINIIQHAYTTAIILQRRLQALYRLTQEALEDGELELVCDYQDRGAKLHAEMARWMEHLR